MIRALTIAAAAALTLSTSAQAVENPTTIAGAKVVSPAEAKAAADKGAMIVDVRSKNEYAEEHIAGAKIVPYKERSKKVADFDMSKDKFDVSKLGSDKSAAMIFYCNGTSCWKSFKASTTAVKAGYTGVLWLREGIPGWKAAGLPTK